MIVVVNLSLMNITIKTTNIYIIYITNNHMKQKQLQKPEFVTIEKNGIFYLEAQIPKKIEEELKKEILKTSGTIVSM